MKAYHVMLPILGEPAFDAQYDALLTQLNERNATLHLIAQADSTLLVQEAERLNDRQREQISQLTVCLKCEALDRLAESLKAHYPRLEFEYHADTQSIDKSLITLSARLEPHAVIIDDRQMIDQAGSSMQAALHNLSTNWDLPVWHVGSADDAANGHRTATPASVMHSGASLAQASARAMLKAE